MGLIKTNGRNIRYPQYPISQKVNKILSYTLIPRIEQKMHPQQVFTRDPVQCIIEMLIIVGALNCIDF